MYEQENEITERRLSRSDKILVAKSAFTQNKPVTLKAEYIKSDLETNDTKREMSPVKKKHHFGMVRMVTAGVLFFLLIAAFHFQITTDSFNREAIEQALSDETHWNELVQYAVQVIGTIQK